MSKHFVRHITTDEAEARRKRSRVFSDEVSGKPWPGYIPPEADQPTVVVDELCPYFEIKPGQLWVIRGFLVDDPEVGGDD